MSRTTNRFDRTEQCVRWILSNWPAGREVYIKWVDMVIGEDGPEPNTLGQTYREGNDITIEIKRLGCRRCLISTAIHETAHAILWPQARAEFDVEHHPGHFYTLIGEIENRWEHDNGAEESYEF